MYCLYGHSFGHTGSIYVYNNLLMNNIDPNKTQIEIVQEANYERMLSSKETKGVRCSVILPEGKQITWLLFPKAIIPSWLNSKSLLSFRVMTRDERRSIKKPLSKR